MVRIEHTIMNKLFNPHQKGNVTMYTVKVVRDGTSVIGQGCTTCTTVPCYYVQQATTMFTNITIVVAYINGAVGSEAQNSTTIRCELLRNV